MILLWFVFGIALILGIARYNESNKLFWTLLLAYVMGFAGTKMYIDVHNGNEKDNVNLTQVYSTQVPKTNLNTMMYYITGFESKADNVVTAQQLVGQGILLDTDKKDVALSEIFGKVRDQPMFELIKPPEIYLDKAVSANRDYG